MFFKTCVHNHFPNFTQKTPVLDSLSNKFSGPQACKFIKKRVQHRHFVVKFGDFLRRPFFYRITSVSEKVDDLLNGRSFHMQWKRFKVFAFLHTFIYPYSHRKIEMKREYRFYMELRILKLLLLYKIYQFCLFYHNRSTSINFLMIS